MDERSMDIATVTPQRMEWSPDNVRLFWEYWSQRPDLEDRYFARQVGEAVLEFVSCYAPLVGAMVLDLGSGPGFLVDRLLNRGARVHAADVSERSIARLEKRLAGREGWLGARLLDGPSIPWPNGTFDLVCCLETIEHLTDVECAQTLAEARRVLKPSGKLLVTTPNEERLEENLTLCPNCGSIYHRMQHLRSWSAADLARALEQAGFDVRFCAGLNFSASVPVRQSLYTMSLRDIVRWVRGRAGAWLKGNARSFPDNPAVAAMVNTGAPIHLAAIAERRAG